MTQAWGRRALLRAGGAGLAALGAAPALAACQGAVRNGVSDPALGLQGPPQMVLRLGYLDDCPQPVSLRMPVAR